MLRQVPGTALQVQVHAGVQNGHGEAIADPDPRLAEYLEDMPEPAQPQRRRWRRGRRARAAALSIERHALHKGPGRHTSGPRSPESRAVAGRGRDAGVPR